MVDTSKATPRPWVREGRTIFALQDAKWHGKPIQVNRISASVQAGTNCDESEAEASAALIVQAVNSFDQLVEALEVSKNAFAMLIDASTIPNTTSATAWANCIAAESKVRAALTSAKAISIAEGRAQ